MTTHTQAPVILLFIGDIGALQEMRQETVRCARLLYKKEGPTQIRSRLAALALRIESLVAGHAAIRTEEIAAPLTADWLQVLRLLAAARGKRASDATRQHTPPFLPALFVFEGEDGPGSPEASYQDVTVRGHIRELDALGKESAESEGVEAALERRAGIFRGALERCESIVEWVNTRASFPAPGDLQ